MARQASWPARHRVRADRPFTVTVVVPELAPGDHTISATAPNVVAATLFTVVPGEVALSRSLRRTDRRPADVRADSDSPDACPIR